MSTIEKMTISGDGSCLVPRPARGGPAPKAQRFYNWSEDGPVPFEREVAFDRWHIRMCIAGIVRCEGPEEAIRHVDRQVRDRQLQAEARIGWDKAPPRKIAKAAKPKTVTKPADDPPKDSD